MQMKRESKRKNKYFKRAEEDIKRGAWTSDEDTSLIHAVTSHGEARWTIIAKSAGLKRTGKSCRLRWRNYLKPGIKRGNLTPQEQLIILDLHSKLGNRWSKIAAELPGRTDNEIKNYWRTKVQKQAKKLNIESNSQSFTDVIRCYYMPRLAQKIEQSSTTTPTTCNSAETSTVNIPQQQPTPSSSAYHPVVPEEEFYNVLTSTYEMDLEYSMLSIFNSHEPKTDWLTAHDVADVDAIWEFDDFVEV